MKIKLDNVGYVGVGSLPFDQFREFMGEFLSLNPSAGKAWDLLTCLRGPDAPSDRPDQSTEENEHAYARRRERKYRTVEIIREVAFFGTVGGAARHHLDVKVTLPPAKEWDHFDKHVARAAKAVGLRVVEVNGEMWA